MANFQIGAILISIIYTIGLRCYAMSFANMQERKVFHRNLEHFFSQFKNCPHKTIGVDNANDYYI